jgi:hypothetical protein
MASLGWIHFSQAYRDRVNTILDMMDEEGMVDELGVGAFRDAFADIFFPGVSTIQTRAKYFFIIPYLIKDYFNLPSKQQADFGKYLYDAEHELMWELAALYNFDRTSGTGVIGITKRPRERISRRPSSVYWSGLRKLGFIKTRLNLSEYTLRANQNVLQKITRTIDAKGDESDDADVDLSDGHGIKVSTYSTKWKSDIDVFLQFEEADYFRKQIGRTVPESLLGHINLNQQLRRYFLDYKNFDSFAKAALNQIQDADLKAQIVLAHDLNEVVRGLHWVYSNEINKLHYKDDRYYEKWKEWKKTLYDNLIDLPGLSGAKLVMIAPRANYYSKMFIQKVLAMVQQKKIDYRQMAEWVIQQERNVKASKSRFKPGAEKDFRKGEAKSLSFLNYRYGNAQTIVEDIVEGLKR